MIRSGEISMNTSGNEMFKFLQFTTEKGIIYEISMDIIIDMRAVSIAEQETKDKNDFYKIYSKEKENSAENDHIVLEWVKENLDYNEILFHAIKMKVLKNHDGKNWKETINVVMH